jgi:DNA gyrase subunit A
MGRTAAGVRGISLSSGDDLVGVDVVVPDQTLLAIAENGYGKRSEMDEYRLQSRGGKGIITMRTTDKTGQVVGVKMVSPEDEIMLVTGGGKVIRIPVGEISVIGRNTQGVRLIVLGAGEQVVGFARLDEVVNDDDESAGEAGEAGEGEGDSVALISGDTTETTPEDPAADDLDSGDDEPGPEDDA